MLSFILPNWNLKQLKALHERPSHRTFFSAVTFHVRIYTCKFECLCRYVRACVCLILMSCCRGRKFYANFMSYVWKWQIQKPNRPNWTLSPPHFLLLVTPSRWPFPSRGTFGFFKSFILFVSLACSLSTLHHPFSKLMFDCGSERDSRDLRTSKKYFKCLKFCAKLIEFYLA